MLTLIWKMHKPFSNAKICDGPQDIALHEIITLNIKKFQMTPSIYHSNIKTHCMACYKSADPNLENALDSLK